jgi:hypothetical protein
MRTETARPDSSYASTECTHDLPLVMRRTVRVTSGPVAAGRVAVASGELERSNA